MLAVTAVVSAQQPETSMSGRVATYTAALLSLVVSSAFLVITFFWVRRRRAERLAMYRIMQAYIARKEGRELSAAVLQADHAPENLFARPLTA